MVALVRAGRVCLHSNYIAMQLLPFSAWFNTNLFSSLVFFPYGHMGGLSLEPFHLHNFPVCFPCWDVPLGISRCCSCTRRLLLNRMCLPSTCYPYGAPHPGPTLPKRPWKGNDRSCTLIREFFPGGSHGVGQP